MTLRSVGKDEKLRVWRSQIEPNFMIAPAVDRPGDPGLWRCPRPDYEVASWTEQTDAIAPRPSMIGRARAEPCRQVGTEPLPCVARDFGVGW